MPSSKFPPAVPVLIFGERKRLLAICASVYAAARIARIDKSDVSRACHGIIAGHSRLMFRLLNPKIELEMSDFGNLTVKEYDEMCGVKLPMLKVKRRIKAKQQTT